MSTSDPDRSVRNGAGAAQAAGAAGLASASQGRAGAPDAAYDQARRPLELFCSLPLNTLLVVGLHGTEEVSRLFHFDLDLLAKNGTVVPFEPLLGKPVVVRLRLPEGRHRYFSGYCSRFHQGMRDVEFTHYRMEVVPHLWFLTLRAQSRTFQQIRAPDLLKEVLDGYGFDVVYDLRATYHPRDYCVQYRETDFNFISRMMEEEGIFYRFVHRENGLAMVVADGPHGFGDLEPPALFDEIEGGRRPEDRVFLWEKSQEVRSGKVTLWDHTFELPHKHLEADALLDSSVRAGAIDHKLRIPHNDRLEVYDYPGANAQRFDGVDPMGGDRPADLQRIFEDNVRTARTRMQERQTPSLTVEGSSGRGDFVAGARFALERHFDADGRYLLTRVHHAIELEGRYRSSSDSTAWRYTNTFTCIPAEAPFRPARTTPKPVIQGPQTAVVTGPPGEEIFTDKYGRVKVQFHWDRQGKHDARSSCWVRVAQAAAGGRWGAIFLPRVGQEVVVSFEEGEPDRPLITGCVYNAALMPPFPLPGKKMISGYRSNSYPGGGGDNEISVDDTKGKERMFMHAQYDQDTVVEHDRVVWVRGAEKHRVGGTRHETVVGDRHLVVKAKSLETVHAAKHLHVKGEFNEKVDGASSVTVGGDRQLKVGGTPGSKYAVKSTGEIHLDAGMKVVLEAGAQLTLKGPGGFIDIGPAGVAIQGTMVLINSGGAAGSGSGSSPTAPADGEEAPQSPPPRP